MWLLLELAQLLLSAEPEPPPLDSRLQLVFALEKPTLAHSHRTVLSRETQGNWVCVLSRVGKNPVENVIVDFEVEGVDELSDLVNYLLRSAINLDLLADVLAQSFLDWL